MEIRDVAELVGKASAADGTKTVPLHPGRRMDNSLLALDLVEVEQGSAARLDGASEERVIYVLAGSGEAVSSSGGAGAHLRADTLLRADPGESYRVRNNGQGTLRLLVVTSLIAWSPRALGQPQHKSDHQAQPSTQHSGQNTAPQSSRIAETPAPAPERAPVRVAQSSTPAAPATPQVQVASEPVVRPEATATRPATDPPAVRQVAKQDEDDDDGPRPDITGLMKRASELTASPAAARKRTPEPAQPAPVQEPEPQPVDEGEEEESENNLMELIAVFDGGSRGNPGQGYGSFLVQSPGRKPVIKRVEFGDNYTNNQAEYDSLIRCLQYIIQRLEITNRAPDQVQLEIKTDSDLVVNQLMGTYKVKDAGLRKRHQQALELLDRFALWNIEWHDREESVKLLGH